jgi:hypothetical protein
MRLTRPLREGVLLLAGDEATPAIRLAVEPGALRMTCVVGYEPPAATIAHRRASGRAWPPVSEDMARGLIRLDADLATAAGDEPLDVVVRITPTQAQLLLDGVLVDEDWPWGLLRGAAEGCTVASDRDAVLAAQAWPRALSDAEIVGIAGGEARVERRRRELLGEPRASLQYFRPPGHNTNAGDTMCLWDGKRFHVFWLFDRRDGTSKWECGGHQFHHSSSSDLHRWTHHGLAVGIDEPHESIGTGTAVIDDAGRVLVFHKNCGERWSPGEAPQGSGLTVADDGLRFTKRVQW